MDQKRKIASRTIGILSLLMAGLGIIYTAIPWVTAPKVFFSNNPETPFFLPAYIVMVLICFSFYVGLIYFGSMFIKLKTQLRVWFLTLLVMEVAYFLGLGAVWAFAPFDIGISVGAATGIANGGLMIQIFTLFPIWAPLIIFWANPKLKLD